MPTLIGVINGVTYNEEDFLGVAYASSPGFFSAMRDIVAHVALGWIGLSGTSLSVGTGTKSLTIDSGGYAFAAGVPVRLIRVSDPAGTFMEGTVTAWDATTRAMDVDVTAVVGSGTHTDWRVVVVRSATVAGSSPLPIADGGTASNTKRGAQASLGLNPVRSTYLFSATPDGSPSTARVYLVGSGATGAWAGHDSEWATWNGSAWVFESPLVGDVALVEQDEVASRIGGGTLEKSAYQYNGTSWVRWLNGIHSTVTLAGSGGSLTIGSNHGPAREVVRLRKSATGTHTLTLPAAPGAAPPAVLVINDSSSGDITVNVASGGTVDGGASLAIVPGVTRMIVWAGTSGRWHSL